MNQDPDQSRKYRDRTRRPALIDNLPQTKNRAGIRQGFKYRTFSGNSVNPNSIDLPDFG
jgi:hypothetical protein